MNRRDYDPTGGMLSLREAMNRLLEDSFVAGVLPGTGTIGGLQMPLDVYETGAAVVVRASLPGVRPEEIDITVTGDTLTIRGQIHDPTPGGGVRPHQREHRFGTITRSITLPIEVQSDKVEATFEHGVLTLTMPKAARLQPKTIKIATRGGQTTIEARPSQSHAQEHGQEHGQVSDAGPDTEYVSGEGAGIAGTTGPRQGSAGGATTQTAPGATAAAGPSDVTADTTANAGKTPKSRRRSAKENRES